MLKLSLPAQSASGKGQPKTKKASSSLFVSLCSVQIPLQRAGIIFPRLILWIALGLMWTTMRPSPLFWGCLCGEWGKSRDVSASNLSTYHYDSILQVRPCFSVLVLEFPLRLPLTIKVYHTCFCMSTLFLGFFKIFFKSKI